MSALKRITTLSLLVNLQRDVFYNLPRVLLPISEVLGYLSIAHAQGPGVVGELE